MNQNIVEVTQENAQQVIMDGSMDHLVVVDFWADWCAPCKSLLPLLEKLATEYSGQMVLAKVNADDQQMLAAQFGVRSLPTVVLIKDGQMVDGFMGAQSESAVREMLDKHLPKPWDLALQQARVLIENSDFSAALPVLRQAHTASGQRADIAFALSHTLLELNRIDEAEQILDAVGLADQDAEYRQLHARITLLREAAKTPEIQALEEKLQAQPENMDIHYQLALQYSQNGHHREALELLIGILRKNLNYEEGAAKAALMDIIAALGKGDPLAAEYQRKMYTLLY